MRNEGIDVEEHLDSVRNSIRCSSGSHTPVAGSAKNHIVENFVLEDRNQVFDVRGQTDAGAQVMSLTHASQCRCKNLVGVPAKNASDWRPFPAASERTVHEDKSRHYPSLRPLDRQSLEENRLLHNGRWPPDGRAPAAQDSGYRTASSGAALSHAGTLLSQLR